MSPASVRIPKGVKAAAVRGLALRKQYGRGGTDVGLTTARMLSRSTHVTPEEVAYIARYFPRHQHDNLAWTDPPSNGYIAWQLWGGNAGWRWAAAFVRRWRG